MGDSDGDLLFKKKKKEPPLVSGPRGVLLEGRCLVSADLIEVVF